MFENAGVARTERSIINWCHPDKHGVNRLDTFYDPNERKYFITPQSVELAIKEEQAKAKVEEVPNGAEAPASGFPKASETADEVSENDKKIKELEQKLADERILNKGKDYFIERMTTERDQFITTLKEDNYKIGKLEQRLLQLEGPKPSEEARSGPADPYQEPTRVEVTEEEPEPAQQPEHQP